MIQDIAPHRLRNEYRTGIPAGAESYLFVFKGHEILLLDREDEVCFPGTDILKGGEELTFLFMLDDHPCFLADEPADAIPDGYAYRHVKSLRNGSLAPREHIFAAYTALQLYLWYRDNVYCGTCGSRTQKSENERALKCPHCSRTIYPRIIPAVIVAVTNGDRIVLTQYANRAHTFYALVAGFTEIGETIEETVHREVMEELGLKVKNLRYYKSQPWGIADDILMGFFCDVDGDDTIKRDENELKEAAWFRREEVVLQPTDFSLTNEMMQLFMEGKEPR